MVYCKQQDVERKPGDNKVLRASRYFNARDEDVTEILAGDVIKIMPINALSEGIPFVVESVDDDGWITPAVPKLNIDF